jgi:hypothetical protein
MLEWGKLYIMTNPRYELVLTSQVLALIKLVPLLAFMNQL